MTVKFVLREDKADKNGLVPVFIDATFEGLRLRCFTREKCLPKEWNADKQRGSEEANSFLEAIYERVRVANPAARPEEVMAGAITAFASGLRGWGYVLDTLQHYGAATNHVAAVWPWADAKRLLDTAL